MRASGREYYRSSPAGKRARQFGSTVRIRVHLIDVNSEEMCESHRMKGECQSAASTPSDVNKPISVRRIVENNHNNMPRRWGASKSEKVARQRSEPSPRAPHSYKSHFALHTS